MVTYSVRGRVTHLLAWGAVNARPRPATLVEDPAGRVQARLLRRLEAPASSIWKHLQERVPRLRRARARVVRRPACKASNGSYWALQSWQTALPDLGFAPVAQASSGPGGCTSRTGRGCSRSSTSTRTGSTAAASRRSSASTPTRAQGVRGFGTTDVGRADRQLRPAAVTWTRTTRPTARAGCARTRSSRTGRPGCSATASTARNPCVGGYAHPRCDPEPQASGRGPASMYRITAAGPGVTPDVMWQGAWPPPVQSQQPVRRVAREPDERHAGRDPRQLAEVPQALAAWLT